MIPPFYANPDDTHCWQSCLRMVLECFRPGDRRSWVEWDRLTGKKEGKWTWPIRGIYEMQKLGFEVLNWTAFDYRRFSEEGEAYLIEWFGKEAAAEQIKNSDIPYEIENARELISIVGPTKIPEIADLNRLLQEGYLLICNVNHKALHDKLGYQGHFVTIYGVMEDQIQLHDPGPPPREGLAINVTLFEKAWTITSLRDRNVMAFREKSHV